MQYDDIIRNRLAEIFNEVQSIDSEIEKLESRLEQMAAAKERRIKEYRMLQHIQERGLVDEGKRVSRIDFEDAMKQIFNQAGRPLSISELIDRLEEFGYIWSNYNSAWYRLTSSRMLEPTGARGYYNLIKI